MTLVMLKRYAAAIAITLAALALFFLLPTLRDVPFLFFFGAVAVVSYKLGFAPAIISSVLSALLAEYFLIAPVGTVGWSAADAQKVTAFLLVSLVIAALARARAVAERSAAEARSRMAAIVECSDDVIISKDLNGIIKSWNPAAERLFGYKPEEAIGRHITLIVPQEHRGEVENILQKIRRGERVEHYETERVAKDGRRVPVSLSISAIRNEEGVIIGASKIARDVTERRRAEEVLRRTEKLAATGRMAATVAHELNNPLEAVTNLLYLAKIDKASAQQYVEMAGEELRRVSHLARQTLSFYKETATPAALSLSTILDDLLSLYRSKIDAKRITIIRRYGFAAPIIAAEGEMRQLFSNLLLNSLDAMHVDGRLQLRVLSARDGSAVRVTVADNGSGIADHLKMKIWEPFFTTKEDVGTGLGLWVTQTIVERYGGSIRFRSSARQGQSGTVFSVVLPLNASKVAESAFSEEPVRASA